MVSIVKDGEFGSYMSEKREIYGMEQSMQAESGKGKLMWKGKAMSSFCSIRLHMFWLDGKHLLLSLTCGAIDSTMIGLSMTRQSRRGRRVCSLAWHGSDTE